MAEQMLNYMYIHTYIDTVITPPDGVGVGQAGQHASKLVGGKNMVGTLIFLPTVGVGGWWTRSGTGLDQPHIL